MARSGAEDIRQRLLQVAEERIWRYGFKKTTIDEIASDAGVGKGTVYLHFNSKEDIGAAVVAQYKQHSLKLAEQIARDPSKEAGEKLKEMLILPVRMAHQRCSETPAVQEMVMTLRPYLRDRLRPYSEHEYALLAEVLEEGNRRGVFDVSDTLRAARSLKFMTLGLMPPYPCVSGLEEIESELRHMIDIVIQGLRRCS